MTQLDNIRKTYFEEGKNISQISRLTDFDRKTVRTYIEKEDWNVEKQEISTESGFPKLEPYKSDINDWLTQDKQAK